MKRITPGRLKEIHHPGLRAEAARVLRWPVRWGVGLTDELWHARRNGAEVLLVSNPAYDVTTRGGVAVGDEDARWGDLDANILRLDDGGSFDLAAWEWVALG